MRLASVQSGGRSVNTPLQMKKRSSFPSMRLVCRLGKAVAFFFGTLSLVGVCCGRLTGGGWCATCSFSGVGAPDASRQMERHDAFFFSHLGSQLHLSPTLRPSHARILFFVILQRKLPENLEGQRKTSFDGNFLQTQDASGELMLVCVGK